MKPLSIPLKRFKLTYFITGMIILLAEIGIGSFVHDRFLRPYAGDFLVVILLYCFVRAFINVRVIPAALAVLLFSGFVEWMQYLKLADRLHLGAHAFPRVLIGNYFSWADIFCYTSGITLVLIVERFRLGVN